MNKPKRKGQSQWSVRNCWQFVVEQIASWSLCWRLICKWPRFILPLNSAPMTWHQNGCFVYSARSTRLAKKRPKLFELIQRKKINDSTMDPLLDGKHFPLPSRRRDFFSSSGSVWDFSRLWLSSNKMKLNKFLSQILFAYCQLCHRQWTCVLLAVRYFIYAARVTFIYGNCLRTFSKPFTLGLYARLLAILSSGWLERFPFLFWLKTRELRNLKIYICLNYLGNFHKSLLMLANSKLTLHVT